MMTESLFILTERRWHKRWWWRNAEQGRLKHYSFWLGYYNPYAFLLSDLTQKWNAAKGRVLW